LVIREIHLLGFKRFQDERLPMAPLTLLTGFNSGGKSSAMQGLLLLHHAAAGGIDPAASGTVALNAPGLTLGDLGTVCNETAADDTFTLGLTAGETTVAWTLGWSEWPSKSLSVPVKQIVLNGALFEGKQPNELAFVTKALGDNPGAMALLQSLTPSSSSPRIGSVLRRPIPSTTRAATRRPAHAPSGRSETCTGAAATRSPCRRCVTPTPRRRTRSFIRSKRGSPTCSLAPCSSPERFRTPTSSRSESARATRTASTDPTTWASGSRTRSR
jgi:hypothetical protein